MSRPKLLIIGLFVTSLLAGLVFASPKALAVAGSQWQPGNVMSDSIFFNSGSMSADQVQAFLDSKVPICDTNGTQPISPGSSTTRAQWAAANGKPAPPYTCLKNYSQATPTMAADAYCSGGVTGNVKTAAQIIKEVAAACSINPQVLIVLLQKEQSLVTDDWPWPRQYEAATGFSCPDTAPCDPSFAGFFYQVYYAARQFQRYVKQPQLFNYRAGQTSYVLWNVATTNCGGSNVYLQSQATAALYNYTPYQPNQAALNNLYGTGDGCSAYGNRNFWRMFNDWFGTTVGDLVQAVGDQTVYLLSGTKAYAIYDVNILHDYSYLGPVRLTYGSEINSYSSGGILGRMVGDPGGALYLVNANIKLPFNSCSSVADYGYSCSQVTYLTTLQLNKLVNGPPITPLLKAVSNPTVYYVTEGTKRPFASWSDVQRFPIPIMNTLTDAAVHQIPYNGAVVYGPGTLVKTPNSPSVYLVKDLNNILPISSFIYPQELGLGTNVRTIASSYSVLGNLENKLSCSSANYVGTNGASYLVSSAMMTNYGYTQSQFVEGGTLCSNIPISPQALGQFIRINNGAIYYVTGGQKRYITSYSVYQSNGGNSSNTILVSDFFVNTLSDGPNLSS